MNTPSPLPVRTEISEDLGRELAARVKANNGSAEIISLLRQEHPGLRFTLCSENDIPARMPVWLEHEGIAVYLLDATEHCVSLTTNPERACGLLFALTDDDE